MMSGAFSKGDCMDEKQINKIIGLLVMAIVVYQILIYVEPYLFYCVISLVLVRVLQEHFKNKK